MNAENIGLRLIFLTTGTVFVYWGGAKTLRSFTKSAEEFEPTSRGAFALKIEVILKRVTEALDAVTVIIIGLVCLWATFSLS
jgi:hypothetical protein